jgi:transcriptional regulator with XRE-family HTH domain
LQWLLESPSRDTATDADSVRVAEIGVRLRAVRLRRGMNLTVLAGLVGVSASYLSMVENGKRNVDRYSLIVALAEALGVPPGEFAPGMVVKRNRLAARRKAIGFSQEQLADRLRIDRSTVGRWESGETAPQPWVRTQLAKVLQVSADKLDELLAEGKPDSLAEIVSDLSQVSAQALTPGSGVPNELLKRALAESDCSNSRLARSVVDLAARDYGISVKYDHSSVIRWINGQRPRDPVREIVALVMSEQLGRIVTPADIGMPDPGSPDTEKGSHKYGISATLPESVTAIANEVADDELNLTSNINPVALEQLWDESLEIARAGNRPAMNSFTAAHRLRARALKLAGQTRRPGLLSDLYRMSGQATALMASAAFDLNQWDASASLARSAISHASLAGHESLESWTFGLAALLANWREEPDTALRLIERGLRVAPQGNPRVRLRFIASRSYALLGDRESVTEILNQARRDQDDAECHRDRLADEVAGEFAFGTARAEACAAAAWLDLRDGPRAQAAAQRAMAELQQMPTGRQSISQMTGVRIDMATACLLNHELDEATELLIGTLNIQPVLRNMSLSGRLTRARNALTSPHWSADSRARELADTIGDWLATDPGT